jgi:hypothetical protein
MSINFKISAIFLSLTFCTGAACAEQNTPCEREDLSTSLYLSTVNNVQTRHYKMGNSNSKEHFSPGGKWTVTMDQTSETWTGRGAGVKAEGHLDCENGNCSTILQGTAVVNIPAGSQCEHYIVVMPDGANAINVSFSQKTGGTCTGSHPHDDTRIHGGSAHGTGTD